MYIWISQLYQLKKKTSNYTSLLEKKLEDTAPFEHNILGFPAQTFMSSDTRRSNAFGNQKIEMASSSEGKSSLDTLLYQRLWVAGLSSTMQLCLTIWLMGRVRHRWSITFHKYIIYCFRCVISYARFINMQSWVVFKYNCVFIDDEK